jgi:hypothetical protein
MNRAEVDKYRGEILDRLTRIEEKHDAHVSVTTEIKGMVALQNGRVRTLENRQSWFLGVGSVLVFIFGTIIAYIW